MRTILKKHNKIAYKKVMAALETSRMTCVCHPTGTGKSYIAAAVAESFDKVLVLAPGKFVLNQIRSLLDWKDHVEYRNYQWLILNVLNLTNEYDLIVLDEFHRIGGDEWGAAVRLLVENQQNAKVLGLTATPIRSHDDRDMADELFGRNIASQMSIAEAWAQKILPIPTYITGIFNFNDIVNDAIVRISKSRRISKEKKRERIYRLSNTKLDWEKSSGMVRILQKHIEKTIKRIIVFCPRIERLPSMRDETIEWFHKAGFEIAFCGTIHSNLTRRQQRDVMQDFEANDGDGVRLIFCVDMLNEGIHVPDVGAVIMLRTTESRIIYMQQLGRVLTTSNTNNPIVLDMVDNLTTTTAIKEFYDEYERLQPEPRESSDPKRFEIIDYTQSVRELIEKLVPEEFSHLGTDDRLAIVRVFEKEHHRMPSSLKEQNEYRHWRWLLTNAYNHPEVQAYISKYGLHLGYRKHTFEESLKMFTDFYDEYGRLPKRKNGKKEGQIEAIWKNARKHHLDHPVVHEYVEKVRRDNEAAEDKKIAQYAKTVTEICESKTSSLSQIPEWRYLEAHHPANPLTIELRKKYGKFRMPTFSVDKRIAMVLEYCKEKGYLPKARDGNTQYIWRHLLKSYPDHPGVKEIVDNYSPYDRMSTQVDNALRIVRQFTDDNGRLPKLAEGVPGAKWKSLTKLHRDHPEVQALIKEYGYAPDQLKKICDDVRAYYEANDCFPRFRDEPKLYARWKRIRKKHPDREDVQELMALDVKRRRTMQEEQRIDKYERFLAKHGHHARRGLNEKEYNLWSGLYSSLPNHPRIMAIVEKYGRSYMEWKKQNSKNDYGTEETE